jgi:NAD-dependent dihydropyrimidine dehydrogenase PreA subunit
MIDDGKVLVFDGDKCIGCCVCELVCSRIKLRKNHLK